MNSNYADDRDTDEGRERKKREAAAVAAATAALAIPVTKIVTVYLARKLARPRREADETDEPEQDQIEFDEEAAVDIPIQ